jgi:hypothetical protein
VYSYSVLRFVPDPARGEAVNLGLLVGDDDAQEWELRLIQNLRRAKAVDDHGVLQLALSFVDQLETHIEALERVSERSSVAPISSELVTRLAGEMQNIVQLTPPAPVVAASAEEALDLLFDELLVDPTARRYRFLKKHPAVGATRRAYRNHHVPDEAIERRAPITAGAYDGVFDFAVYNGKALQLVHCWSFQLPNQEELAEQVKAWAWVVREVRARGGILRAAGREVQVPSGDDFEIAAVFIPPADGQGDVHAYEEARAAFEETHVLALQPDQADELGERAAERLQVATA